MLKRIAALYVEKNGVYYGLEGVDCWDAKRDARLYQGAHPVVAHPPCARWGRYWSGGPSNAGKFKLGDDGGCFASALEAVRNYGGVLEHPADSKAWDRFDLVKPPREGGWVHADDRDGWTCCVEQGHYGHPARKMTWLYAVGTHRPELKWGSSGQRLRMDDGYHSAEERKRARRKGQVHFQSKAGRARTPLEFRDLLISLTRSAY